MAKAPEAVAPTAIVKHSLNIAGHRTSVSLEDAFWHALKNAAAARGLSIAALVAEIDEARGDANLSSAIRVHLLRAVASSTAVNPPPEPGEDAKRCATSAGLRRP